MWSFIATIFIGLIVGLVARLLTPGRSVSGFIMTSLLGVSGAIVAKFLGQSLDWYSQDEPVGFLASVLGAMLILFAFNLASAIFQKDR